jgi:hypothetical protein
MNCTKCLTTPALDIVHSYQPQPHNSDRSFEGMHTIPLCSMASLPACTVEPPQLNHAHWSPASYMSRSNAMPHYATPILAPTPGTSPACSRPLSPSISVSCPSYSTSSLGLIFPPTSSTINPYADEHLHMVVSSGMHPLSSVSSTSGAQPIEVYGAKPLTPEFEVFNKPMQNVTSTRFGIPVTSLNGLRTLGGSAGSSDDGSLSGIGSGSSGNGLNRPRPSSSEPLTVRTGSNKAETERSTHGNVSREVARRKRSRIANACKRCQIRKARVCHLLPSTKDGFTWSLSQSLTRTCSASGVIRATVALSAIWTASSPPLPGVVTSLSLQISRPLSINIFTVSSIRPSTCAPRASSTRTSVTLLRRPGLRPSPPRATFQASVRVP